MQRPEIIPGSRNIRHDIPYGGVPAPIRYKNPCAQWPSEQAEKYGMIGYGQLNDGDNQGAGNKIALFPNAVYGAACNMGLLSGPKYVRAGLTIGAVQVKWSGQHRAAIPGYDSNTVITPEMVRDPEFMLPFMKIMADAEAPRGSRVLSDAQWREAFDLYQLIEGQPATKKRTVKTEHAGAGTVIVVSSGAAKASKDAGHSSITVAAIVFGGIALAVVTYLLIKKFKTWRASWNSSTSLPPPSSGSVSDGGSRVEPSPESSPTTTTQSPKSTD